MRQIGNLPDERQARLFGDYLFAQGIHNQVEPDADASWTIWVMDEDKLETAGGMLERFRRDASSPEFARVAVRAAELREKEAQEIAAYRKRFKTRGQIFRGTGETGAGFLTVALVVACVASFFLSRFGKDETFIRHLLISEPEYQALGFLPEVRSGEVWRLFTPVLIHFSIMHLVFNMMWLFNLGSRIENLQGRTFFVLLTAAIAIGSNLAEYAAHFHGEYRVFGGMSGVVYGLFGYIWMRGKFDPASGLYIDQQNVVLMMVWFFICLTGWVGPVANLAHGGGLVLGGGFGLAAAWLARRGDS